MTQYCLSFPKNWKHIEFIIFCIHKNFGEVKERGTSMSFIYYLHIHPFSDFFFPSSYSMPSTHQTAEKYSVKQTWHAVTERSANSIPSLIPWSVNKLRFSSFLSFYINWQLCTKKFSLPLNTWNMLQSALLFTSFIFWSPSIFHVLFQNNSQATSDSTFHFDVTSINIFMNSMSRGE